MDSYIVLAIYILIGISLLLSVLASKTVSQVPTIINRWVRWFLIAFVIAYLMVELEFTEKPFYVLFGVSFTGWFLIETVYNWFIIKTLSKSPIPLFPRYKVIDKSMEWPSDRYFLNIRDWIKKEGFKQKQVLRAEIMDTISIRSTVFDNENKQIRLQTLFIPYRSNKLFAFFIFFSCAQDGTLFLTDNLSLPYGGFYPDNWRVSRHPLLTSISSLFQKHKKALQQSKKSFTVWGLDPVEQINNQQKLLESINKDKGFLNDSKQQLNSGRITKDGCYRVWKEMLMLNYLGSSLGYK